MTRSADGIKDISDFTVLLARTALGSEEFHPRSEATEDRLVAKVVKVFLDRNNTYAGFICDGRKRSIFSQQGERKDFI